MSLHSLLHSFEGFFVSMARYVATSGVGALRFQWANGAVADFSLIDASALAVLFKRQPLTGGALVAVLLLVIDEVFVLKAFRVLGIGVGGSIRRYRLYLESARQIIQKVNEAGEEVGQLQGGISGALRIIAPLASAQAFLNDASAEFLNAYSEIRLRIDLSDDFAALADGGYDLALQVGHVEVPGLIAKKIGKHRLYICAGPGYVDRNPLPLSPQTVDQHAWLKYVHPALDMKHWWVHKDSVRIRLPYQPQPRLESDNFDVLLANALAGCGVLHTPYWSTARYINDGRLVPLMSDYTIEADVFGEDLMAVYPSHRRANVKVLAFIEHLEMFLAKLEG